ncbi:MAG: alpha-amylase family protein [Lachnospiraceae bacterium]|nr:alpha-amylase family protein [Lachnospiraceae bacterium]
MIERESWKPEFAKRFDERQDELKWLYCEIYKNDEAAYEWLCNSLYGYYTDRKETLKRLDRKRVSNPDWYKQNDMVGMMMYTNAFAGNLKGVKEKLDYVEKSGANYLHFMPLLESPEGKSDGGYAVADFRKVQPELGTMKDLDSLTAACHKRGISCCLDFVMNHTSEDHEWAKAAIAGDEEARKRYFFYDTWDIPNQYEKTVPQVFPTTAPGNFTWRDDCKKIVMTMFYPYQWDLNYANPVVFNDMVGNMLYLANRGIDIIRLDAVPYIWKRIGTDCRNQPEVHTLVRMMRIISEIVCPGTLLLGEVVMEPAKVVPYFGSVEKPECHMLYNVTTMASTWHTVATRDVRLLRRQMDQVSVLPKDYVFLNYLRCHDDIGWGLDYPWLKQFGIDEVAHKKYLNDYLTGAWEGSDSRGELYNDDPTLGDARLCGTTASLCGVEAALFEQDKEKLEKCLNLDKMLHAYMFTQSGIPVIYSGDEIAQVNDYDYHYDIHKASDSRYLHRGDFNWEEAAQVDKKGSWQGKFFYELRKMETLRAEHPVFNGKADVWTVDTYHNDVLGIGRYYEGEQLFGYFNFGGEDREITIPADYKSVNLMTGKNIKANRVVVKPYSYVWALQKLA